MTRRCALLVCVALTLASNAFPTTAQTVGDLRCENLVNPLGIDEPKPRLSWKLATDDRQRRGLRQTAYQVLAASRRELLNEDRADLWNSKRIDSDRSRFVPYLGKALTSGSECWWRVRVWDERNVASAWSDPALWTMGLLTDADWQGAQWIGWDEPGDEGLDIGDLKAAQWLWYPEGEPAHDAPVATRYFRKNLTIPVDRKVTRAFGLFTGDDQCVLYVNGTQVGIARGHINLVGVDIVRALRPGANQLAVAASNAKADVPNNPAGWICAVRVEFDSGPPLVISSDRGWKASNEAKPNWETAEFDDGAWPPALEIGKAGRAPWGIPWADRFNSEHRRLPARYARRTLEIPQDKKIRRASLSICGLGFFDPHVNGRLITDQLMNPALTGYDQRDPYLTFDVTSKLKPGANAVGVVLSNGRFFAPRIQTPIPMKNYGYPKLLAHLRIDYEDGSTQTLVSDQTWKITADGPIRSSNEFDGEEYDARQELSGWASSGFDDSSWKPAQVVKPPGGKLEAQMIEPIRVTKVLEPKQIKEAKPGVWMVDFGQAFYGAVKLKASAPAGTRVSIRTSFNVLPDGTLNFINDRSALNTDVYTFKGESVEEWSPRFRGNATRWAQIEGFSGTPTKENFAGLVLHTDHEVVGRFVCSNETINRAFENASWGTRMQNRSVPMEPDRDERMPWSGHPAKTSESEGWNFDVYRFYDHFLHNYRVHQGDDGSLQEILPPYWNFNNKDIIWPSVATIIPDWHYGFYGDDRIVRDNYEMMKRFVAYHEQKNLRPDATLSFCTYGDWVDAASIGSNSRNFGATSRPLMGTAYFYHNCRLAERAARLLGHSEDEQRFRKLAERVRDGFNRRFFDPATNIYESGTQCSMVLPLAFGLVPEAHRAVVIQNLVEDVMTKHHGHTTVGLIGMQWQMQVLTDIGHPEVAYQIATQTTRPSWGYMIAKGATTSWERWDADTQDGGMNGESQKILSGNFEAWCYQTLAGINYDVRQPGFKHILLRPRPVGDLSFVRASHHCGYGEIVSEWKLDGGQLHWRFVVPPNTTATVYVPTANPQAVIDTESGRFAGATEGIKLVSAEKEVAVFEVGSGAYSIAAPRPTTK